MTTIFRSQLNLNCSAFCPYAISSKLINSDGERVFQNESCCGHLLRLLVKKIH